MLALGRCAAPEVPGLDPSRHRVLVLGNGPVGQTTALLLARWGVPVTVLDAAPARAAEGSRAICQQRDTLDVWCALDVPQIAEEGLTWQRARTFYQDRELFAMELGDPGRSPLPAFVNLSQARTEELLDARLAREPLVEVLWSHEVVGVQQDELGVTVICHTPDGERRHTGAYAVASTGARGRVVRTALGLDFPGRSFDDAFLICDVRADLPGWDRERRFHFDPACNPGRQVLIHPCPGGVFRIDWQVEPGFDLAAEEADGSLDRRIQQVVGDRAYELVWSSVYRFHSRLVTQMRVGRVLLAGDVAHLVAPFGARGLNSGVGDADNAAWKLAFVLHGWSGPELLDSYETERLAAAQENLDVTTSTMDFLVPQDPQAARRRHLLLERTRHDPALGKQVDSGRLAEPAWYVDSPLTTPSPQRRWPGRPSPGRPPAPVPGVILPDVPVQGHEPAARIRDLVRSGVTVLAADPAKVPDVRAALRGALAPGTPTQVLALPAVDPDGSLRQALSAGPDDLWLVRPDAHTAACATSVAAVVAAAQRCVRPLGAAASPTVEP